MVEASVKTEDVLRFCRHLEEEERSPGTIEKYFRDVRAFARWADGAPLTKELTARWKERLLTRGYAPGTINAMLAPLNSFLRFLGREDCRLKFLRIQRRLFRDACRELTKGEYDRLLCTARALGRMRLALVLETICATGIRVSEVRCITVEAARQGRTEISLKGKIRTILLPSRLCRKLLKCTRKNKIASGEIFLTRGGKSLSRKQIWAEMKSLCAQAGVAPTKVFPHNLRHLFARSFYRVCRDVAKLADVLGTAAWRPPGSIWSPQASNTQGCWNE